MSAACYTNRVRTRAQARVTKVQYPGYIANNYDPLFSTGGCSPRFDVLNYILKKSCTLPCVPVVIPPPPPVYVPYNGGNAYTGIYDSEHADTDISHILDAVTYRLPQDIYIGDGDDSTQILTGDFADPASVSNNIVTSDLIPTVSTHTLDGSTSKYSVTIYYGGSVIETSNVILSGGNSNI